MQNGYNNGVARGNKNFAPPTLPPPSNSRKMPPLPNFQSLNANNPRFNPIPGNEAPADSPLPVFRRLTGDGPAMYETLVDPYATFNVGEEDQNFQQFNVNAAPGKRNDFVSPAPPPPARKKNGKPFNVPSMAAPKLPPRTAYAALNQSNVNVNASGDEDLFDSRYMGGKAPDLDGQLGDLRDPFWFRRRYTRAESFPELKGQPELEPNDDEDALFFDSVSGLSTSKSSAKGNYNNRNNNMGSEMQMQIQSRPNLNLNASSISKPKNDNLINMNPGYPMPVVKKNPDSGNLTSSKQGNKFKLSAGTTSNNLNQNYSNKLNNVTPTSGEPDPLYTSFATENNNDDRVKRSRGKKGRGRSKNRRKISRKNSNSRLQREMGEDGGELPEVGSPNKGFSPSRPQLPDLSVDNRNYNNGRRSNNVDVTQPRLEPTPSFTTSAAYGSVIPNVASRAPPPPPQRRKKNSPNIPDY